MTAAEIDSVYLISDKERRVFVEILDHSAIKGAAWVTPIGDAKLYRRLRDSKRGCSYFTHDEHVKVINGLEGELETEADLRSSFPEEISIFTKMAYLLHHLRRLRIVNCPECKAEEALIVTSRAQEIEEKAAKISYDRNREEQISCHNCGTTSQTYWYTLQHVDGTIMKRICIKCSQSPEIFGYHPAR